MAPIPATYKSILVCLMLASSGMISFSGYSQDMPTGASVQSGNITITGTGTNHMVIDQATQKSIINWDSFHLFYLQ